MQGAQNKRAMKINCQFKNHSGTNKTGKNLKKDIKACIKFWELCGSEVYLRNKNSLLGDKETQQIAKTRTMQEFILTMLADDIKQLTRNKKKYESGHSGSHIWIHKNNRRCFIAHF